MMMMMQSPSNRNRIKSQTLQKARTTTKTTQQYTQQQRRKVRFSYEVTYYVAAEYYEGQHYSKADYSRFRKANRRIVDIMKTCSPPSLAYSIIEKTAGGDSVRGLVETSSRQYNIKDTTTTRKKMEDKEVSIQAVLYEQEMQRKYGTSPDDSSEVISIIYKQACERSRSNAIKYGMQDEQEVLREAIGNKNGSEPQWGGTNVRQRQRRLRKVTSPAA